MFLEFYVFILFVNIILHIYRQKQQLQKGIIGGISNQLALTSRTTNNVFNVMHILEVE